VLCGPYQRRARHQQTDMPRRKTKGSACRNIMMRPRFAPSLPFERKKRRHRLERLHLARMTCIVLDSWFRFLVLWRRSGPWLRLGGPFQRTGLATTTCKSFAGMKKNPLFGYGVGGLQLFASTKGALFRKTSSILRRPNYRRRYFSHASTSVSRSLGSVSVGGRPSIAGSICCSRLLILRRGATCFPWWQQIQLQVRTCVAP
jgi:hypothetical protein